MVLWSPWWSVCVDSHKKFATFINKCNNLLAFSYAGLYTFNVNAICTSCGVLHSMTESGGPKSHLPPVAIWLTISNWHMRFHSWQEKAAASEIKNGLRVDIKQEDDRKMAEDWDCQEQKDGRKDAFPGFAHLSKMHLIWDTKWLAIPTEALALGFLFLFQRQQTMGYRQNMLQRNSSRNDKHRRWCQVFKTFWLHLI